MKSILAAYRPANEEKRWIEEAGYRGLQLCMHSEEAGTGAAWEADLQILMHGDQRSIDSERRYAGIDASQRLPEV